MGYFIVDAWMRLNYVEMYAGIVVLGVAGFVFFADGCSRSITSMVAKYEALTDPKWMGYDPMVAW